MEEFHNLNLGIFQPRKDQCDLCCSFATGNVTEDVYNEHVKNKDLAQQEKRMDKALAQSNPKVKVVTMDLQRVLLCPSLKASALYYKTKLCLHNFTIFDLATHDTLCYVWHEVEGGTIGK